MHLSEIKKNATEEDKASWPHFPSENKEKEIVEITVDRYIKLYPNEIHHSGWPFKIEEINSITFDELMKWNEGWRFKAKANVKQTDNYGIVHLAEKLILSGNVAIDWDVKVNPILPEDKDWMPEIKELNITNIESNKK